MSVGPINTLEITVQRKSGASWPVVAEYSRAGLLPTRSEGILEFGEESVQQLTGLLGQPREYGVRLGKALFQEAVRDAFVGALRESEDRLRVLLCIEADDLRTLRWERLGAPIDGNWGVLAQDQRTPFSLYIPSMTDRRFPPIGRRDLRALLLVASPRDSQRFNLAPFDVEATVAGVKSALGEIPCDVLASVAGAIGSPGLDELCARLTDRSRQYTLLHFVCHGKVIEGGETVVYWANADNRTEPVKATDLVERLGRVCGPRGLPHFAFLSTCESASAEAEGALGGLAQRLVRDLGMPAVLAMTEKVTMTTAAALATAFYRQLGQSGEVDTALPEATAALARRGDILVPVLFSRLGGRPLFSDQLDRELTNEEIKFGLDRLKASLAERAPVLQEEFETQAAIVAKTLAVDATALSKDAREERQQALGEINTLCLEAVDLSFNALALGQQPPAYDARCPFRGLYPFRREDREFFFGRETLIEKLSQKLAEENFLAVLGPSGSGKSSVVLAGLVPALQDREKGLQLADLTPGSEPIEHLEAALAKLSDQPAPGVLPGILVVDQFEELFTLCADQAKRLAFIDQVLSLARSRRVVLTMRADFWGDCAPYKDLKERMEARQSLIAPMVAAELRKAMELQAGQVSLRFEAGLSNRILDDVQGEPGAMPLLQHALFELWKRRHGRWLRWSEYEAIGGVQQAIARTADAVYDSLSAAERAQMQNIFVRLTRLDVSAVQGERRRDTRRRVQLEDLVPAGGDPAVTERLVQRLAGAEARLVVTGVDEATQRETVEVAHEALIRRWPRLQTWLDEDRANLLLREAIRQAAEEWQQHAREESYLIHSGARLAAAHSLSERPGFLNRDEQDYVQACVNLERKRQSAEKEEQERRIRDAERIADEQKRATRATLIGLAVAVLVAVVAVWQYFEAKSATNEAVKESKLATSRQWAALAGVGLDLHAPRNLLLALNSIALTRQIGTFSPTGSRQLLIDVLNSTGGVSLQHAAPVAAVEISPDDRWLASASAGDVELWDMQAPSKAPITLRGREKVNAIAFSPDGRTLATVGEDALLRLWNMAVADRAASMRVLTGHDAAIVDVAISPNNRWLATASKDGTARLWDLGAVDPAAASLKLPHERTGNTVNTLAFSSDERWLATGSANLICLWDLLSPTPSAQPITVPVGADVRKVAFSPDSQWLVAGDTETYKVVLMRVDDTAKQFSLNVRQWVTKVAFSPDGRWLATPSQYDARLWDLTKPDPSSEPIIRGGHKDSIYDLAFSPDGKWFATASKDHTVQLWNTTDGFTLSAVLRGHEGPVSRLVFSHDSRRLATASEDHTVRLWSTSSPTAVPLALRAQEGSTELHMWDLRATDLPAAPRSLGKRLDQGDAGSAFSTDGKWLATWRGTDGFVHLWNLSATSPKNYVVRHNGGIWASPVFSSDGRWLMTGGVDDPTIRLWDLNAPDPTRSPKMLRGHRGPVRSLAVSADSRRLVSGANDGLALVWDLTAADPSANPRRLEGGGGTSIVRTVAISGDGRYVVTGSWEPDFAARIWDLFPTGPSSTPVKLTFKGRVFDAAFSADGRWVAAGSWDETTQLLNLREPGAKPIVLQGHTARTLSVAFSPDNQWLATGNEDKTARLWSLTATDPSADSVVLPAPDKVGNVSFSRDGRWLALSQTENRSSPFSPDGFWFAASDSVLYPTGLEDLVLFACRTAGRNLTPTEFPKGDVPLDAKICSPH